MATIILNGAAVNVLPPLAVTAGAGPWVPLTFENALPISTCRILYGVTAPQPIDGNVGDVAIDTSTNMIYGPKTADGWPDGRSIIGLQGLTEDTTGDSIIAKITANRKAMLSVISLANGYSFTPLKIEEKRLMTPLDETPYLQIVRIGGAIDPDANYSDEHTVTYAVFCYIVAPDQGADRKEILYQFRNTIPDIQRAWMADIYCGQLAESTKSISYNDDVMSDSGGLRFYCAMACFEVTARIDSRNPYALA